MTSQELETWARRIVNAVLSGHRIEDSQVELKYQWPEDSEKAAHRLAAHANAERGAGILWIIGVDESGSALTNPAPTEKANWIASVNSHFDGPPPILLRDVNMIARCLLRASALILLRFHLAGLDRSCEE
jgi:hypothetical protein